MCPDDGPERSPCCLVAAKVDVHIHSFSEALLDDIFCGTHLAIGNLNFKGDKSPVGVRADQGETKGH